MPRAPRTPCLHPGCPALVERGQRGRCPNHRKSYEKVLYRERGPSSARGYDARWNRFRRMFLRANPLCACGCGEPAVELHHIEPVNGPDDPLFYLESNLAGLTKSCHSRETMKALNKGRIR
jgi:5-methylcytosine-specific restriction enzyme A